MSATRLFRQLKGGIALGAILALGGCASGGMGAGQEGGTALEVENNLIPATALTIYAAPDIGNRRLIGTVPPGTTRVLRFDPISGGQFQFVAETTFGRELVSNPVSFASGASIRWDVNSNIAVVTDG